MVKGLDDKKDPCLPHRSWELLRTGGYFTKTVMVSRCPRFTTTGDHARHERDQRGEADDDDPEPGATGAGEVRILLDCVQRNEAGDDGPQGKWQTKQRNNAKQRQIAGGNGRYWPTDGQYIRSTGLVEGRLARRVPRRNTRRRTCTSSQPPKSIRRKMGSSSSRWIRTWQLSSEKEFAFLTQRPVYWAEPANQGEHRDAVQEGCRRC